MAEGEPDPVVLAAQVIQAHRDVVTAVHVFLNRIDPQTVDAPASTVSHASSPRTTTAANSSTRRSADSSPPIAATPPPWSS
ncbi:MAG: hypothetical protein HOZ81_37420 [Streptomyces sp.]|nr:hypothetical protein [Streptomyces sp.]NUT25900.1 hypothetical protein [Streptomyces sp.]